MFHAGQLAKSKFAYGGSSYRLIRSSSFRSFLGSGAKTNLVSKFKVVWFFLLGRVPITNRNKDTTHIRQDNQTL
jgi:hypothetical protein